MAEPVTLDSLVAPGPDRTPRLTQCTSSGVPQAPAPRAAFSSWYAGSKRAHEADRDEGRVVRPDHPPALVHRRRERLLAQHRLAGLYRGDHQVGMRRVVRGDHDRVDGRVLDERERVVGDPGVGYPGGRGRRP